MSKYRKAVAGVLGAIVTWGLTASVDGEYDQVEMWGLGAALLAGLGVYGAPRNRYATDDYTE